MLVRALGVLAVVAVPALLVFALMPKLLLRIAFGAEAHRRPATRCFILGVAMTLLAVAYLTVQYMLALGEARFLLGARRRRDRRAVPAERGQPRASCGFAAVVLGLQCLAASGVLALGWRARVKPRAVDPRDVLPATSRAG